MEIVACPGMGSTNCIVVAPAVEKDIDKAKLSEKRAKENSESVIENSTDQSCVEVDAKRLKVIDVVEDDVSDVDDEVSVDTTQTNIEPKGSAENLEGSIADEYLKSGHKNGEGTNVKEAPVKEYPRVIFPATFVRPEIEIEFGSLGKNTLIFPPAFASPELNIKFGSFDDDTIIGLEDSNQETEPPCGVNNNNPERVVMNLPEDEKVTCGTLEDDKASDAQTEDTATGFEDEKLSDTNTVVEDLSRVIEAECDAISNDNRDVTLTDSQQDDEVTGDVEIGESVEDLVVMNALKAVPSFEVEKLNEEIKKARIQLDEKTRLRDAISDKIQKKKASLRARNEGVNAATLKIRAAKQMVKSKRHEIDYVQRVIKKLKRAISAGEIDDKIYEVKDSSDETPFVRIIKQLNSIRDQVSSYMGSHDEIQQALHLEDRIHEVLKNLNKELKTLKEDVSKAELAAEAISKSYKEDIEMEKILKAQFIAAEAIRQEAYGRLNSLKNRLDDEVEEFMDELNTNEELGMFASKKQDTLDGRPSQKVASKSVPVPDEIKSLSSVSTIETQRPISSVDKKHSDDQTKEKVAEENKQIMKTKEMIDNQEREENDELRKADELKKEETETKLKEQSQLDEIMKVEKTMEMNKRNAEKAQTSAEQRAQNEADQRAKKEAKRKDKARLRRLRKKKNKTPCDDARGSSINDVDVAESNEIDNTNEEPCQPHSGLKQKIHVSAPKFGNIKNWLQRSGKMLPIAAALILSLLSLLLHI